MANLILSTTINDSDWDVLFGIYLTAFADAPEIVSLYPGGLDPACRAQNVAIFKMVTNHKPTEVYVAKIIDVKTNTIISYASGNIFSGPRGNIDGDLAQPPPHIQLPFISDPKDREWWEWYWNSGMAIMREREELHVPYIYLQCLCTSPEWQRNGAATMLMKWMTTELTAKHNIRRCVLTASPFALEAGFYERFDFRIIYTDKLVDEERFPGRAAAPLVIMMKDV